MSFLVSEIEPFANILQLPPSKAHAYCTHTHTHTHTHKETIEEEHNIGPMNARMHKSEMPPVKKRKKGETGPRKRQRVTERTSERVTGRGRETERE